MSASRHRHKKKHISAPADCTGCALCANECGHGAISMEWSAEGFLLPVVDVEACVGCGLCVARCPALLPSSAGGEVAIESVVAYGAWNRDPEILRNSSSGGLFYALAEWVIREGGCVFGVVWQDRMTAGFVKAETLEEVRPMCGSKYIMAAPHLVYRDVRAELRRGRRVLFAGTSCQVHALRRYLQRDDEKLLTVDIICHGVPSRRLWEKYVLEMESRKGAPVRHVEFRNKDESWERFRLKVFFGDGTQESCVHWDSLFIKFFKSDVALNRCCYACRYARLPRQGDLTVGDFWEAGQRHPDWPLRDGITALLVNSAAGQAAVRAVSGQMEFRRVDFREIYDGQDMLHDKEPRQPYPYRARLFSEMDRWQLEQLYRRFVGTTLVGPFVLRHDGLIWRVLCRFRWLLGLILGCAGRRKNG